MSASRVKKKKKEKPIHLMGLEEAEHRALGNLIMTTDEASRLSTRLRDEYGQEPVEILLWATVRHLEPRARWEQSFADEATLNKFRASFKRNSYRAQDIPRRLPLPDFFANMRANEHRQDLKQFGRLVKYLKDSKLSWYLTVQTVHAERDPRQLDPGSFWTALGAAFGKRIAYRLEEYCLVVNLILTNVDRCQPTVADPSGEERDADARLLAVLLKEANVTAAATVDASENDANEEDSSSSSGPNSLGVSSSSSSGSSRRPLPTMSALESVVNAAASTAAAQTLGSTLLRSTSYSGSSSSTTAKPRQAFIPVLKSKAATPLSRSASSSSMSQKK